MVFVELSGSDRLMYVNDEQNSDDYKVSPQKLYCPNCAALLVGYKDGDGKLRIKCHKCKTQMTMQRVNRQIDVIEIRIPKSYI